MAVRKIRKRRSRLNKQDAVLKLDGAENGLPCVGNVLFQVGGYAVRQLAVQVRREHGEVWNYACINLETQVVEHYTATLPAAVQSAGLLNEKLQELFAPVKELEHAPDRSTH